MFLFGLTNYEVKLPNSFIKKLQSPIPVSDELTKFIDDCKINPNEIRIRSGGDTSTRTPRNCIYDFFINKGIPISLTIGHLKNGSFYELMIQSLYKSNLRSGSASDQFHSKSIFGN